MEIWRYGDMEIWRYEDMSDVTTFPLGTSVIFVEKDF